MEPIEPSDPTADGMPVDELGGADPFVVTTRTDGAHTVLTLTGELDLDASGRLLVAVRQALARTGSGTGAGSGAGPGSGALTLELHGLNFLDSSGLQALLTARDEIEAAGLTFRIATISPIASRVVEVGGLTHLLSPTPNPQP
jgi:anti-anti-sigma regulatory factor